MHGALLVVDVSAGGPPPVPSWAVAVVGVLALVYLTVIRPQKKKQQADPLARGPSQGLLAQQRAVERDMTALLVEYEGMMRAMTAQLEMRSAKLELLIRDADAKLAELRAAAAAVAAAPTPAIPPAPPALARSAASPSRVNPPAKDDSGAGFDVEPEPDAPVPREAEPPHADVYALADEGQTYRQIAHRLDRPYGEIELILALRPSVHGGGGGVDGPVREDPEDIAPDPAEAAGEALRNARTTATVHPSPRPPPHPHHGGKHRKKHR